MSPIDRLEQVLNRIAQSTARVAGLTGHVLEVTIHNMIRLGYALASGAKHIGTQTAILLWNLLRFALIIIAAIFCWTFGIDVLLFEGNPGYLKAVGLVLCLAGVAIVGVIAYVLYSVVVDSLPHPASAAAGEGDPHFTVFGAGEPTASASKMNPLTTVTLVFGLADVMAIIVVHVLTQHGYYTANHANWVIRITQTATAALLNLGGAVAGYLQRPP